MSALAKYEFVPWSLSEAVVSDFVRKGAHLFEDPVDPRACTELLAEIRSTRRFDESLFLTEAELAAAPPIAGADPKPGCNLAERLEPRLGFLERAPQVVEALWSLLGPDYKILERRIICELPAPALPDWLKRRGHGDPKEGLGAYVRPELRDIAYLRGADFHQALSAEEPEPDFVTLHVYLHPVTEVDAPVHLLEGSHRLGAAAYPHDLKRTGPASWRYRNGQSGDLHVAQRVLTGETGFAALWHACTLHGSPPDCADGERISLRYRVGRGAAAATGLDSVNATLDGPASLAEAPPERAARTVLTPRWNTTLQA
jgi:hypothetical protein